MDTSAKDTRYNEAFNINSHAVYSKNENTALRLQYLVEILYFLGNYKIIAPDIRPKYVSEKN